MFQVTSLNTELDRRSHIKSEELLEKSKMESLIQSLTEEKASLQEEIAKLSYTEVLTSISSEQTRISDLEEELVLVKESHASCIPERSTLQEKIDRLNQSLLEQNSKSQTLIFCYTAPLVLIIAYLLINTIFA